MDQKNTKHGRSVAVIGAGLGGISAAISLAAEGYSVEVYEKNEHLGGKLNILQDKGFTFDLGPSILTMPHIFQRLFQKAGERMEAHVPTVQLELEWRTFFPDNRRIDLYNDLELMDEENSELTEKHRKELESFMDYAREMYELARPGYFEEGIDTTREAVKFYGLFKAFRGFDIFSSMDDVVSRHISSPHLQDLVNFFIKYVGSSPYRAPAVLTLLPYIQNEFGLWYIPGGMSRLAEGLENIARKLGVEFNLNSEIVGASLEEGRITSLQSRSAGKIEADIFVSNMEVIPFYRDITGEDQEFLSNYSSFEPACSGYVLHLGVDKKYPQLQHHNFFFSSNPRKHFADVFKNYSLPEDPTIYLVASSRTDSTVAPEGCENLKILPHIPYIQDEPFTASEYDRLEERLLNKLEEMGLKGLRDNIIYRDVWRPEDIRENYYSNRGSIYGVVADRQKNRGFKAPKSSEKYDNLYFVGGSVNPGGGMPMVALSGQQVADKISGDGNR